MSDSYFREYLVTYPASYRQYIRQFDGPEFSHRPQSAGARGVALAAAEAAAAAYRPAPPPAPVNEADMFNPGRQMLSRPKSAAPPTHKHPVSPHLLDAYMTNDHRNGKSTPRQQAQLRPKTAAPTRAALVSMDNAQQTGTMSLAHEQLRSLGHIPDRPHPRFTPTITRTTSAPALIPQSQQVVFSQMHRSQQHPARQLSLFAGAMIPPAPRSTPPMYLRAYGGMRVVPPPSGSTAK